MRTFFFSLCFLLFSGIASGQKEDFDLVSFLPVKNWRKQHTTEYVSFSSADDKKGLFCSITIYAAVQGESDGKVNFDNAWKNSLQQPLGAGVAKMEKPVTSNGWELQSGTATFTASGLSGTAMLITATSQGRVVNLVALINSDQYSKQLNDFIASVELKKPPVSATGVAKQANSLLAGKIWEGTSYEKYTGSTNMFSTGGFFTWQYKFNNDGTYRFIHVSASVYQTANLLQYETGRYSISGNQLTITPTSGMNEEWSVIGGPTSIAGMSDVQVRKIKESWGKKIKSTKRKLESYRYTFRVEYMEGNKANGLIVEFNGYTEREGDGNRQYYFETPAYKTVTLPAGFGQ